MLWLSRRCVHVTIALGGPALRAEVLGGSALRADRRARHGHAAKPALTLGLHMKQAICSPTVREGLGRSALRADRLLATSSQCKDKQADRLGDPIPPRSLWVGRHSVPTAWMRQQTADQSSQADRGQREQHKATQPESPRSSLGPCFLHAAPPKRESARQEFAPKHHPNHERHDPSLRDGHAIGSSRSVDQETAVDGRLSCSPSQMPHCAIATKKQSGREDSNLRPRGPKPRALPS